MTFKPATSIAIFGLNEVQFMYFGAVAFRYRFSCGRNDCLFVGVVCSLVRCLVRCFCVFFVVLVIVVSFAWHLLCLTPVSLHLLYDVH